MFLNLFHSLHVVGSANDRDAIVDKESRAICRKRSDRALLSYFLLSFFLSPRVSRLLAWAFSREFVSVSCNEARGTGRGPRFYSRRTALKAKRQ